MDRQREKSPLDSERIAKKIDETHAFEKHKAEFQDINLGRCIDIRTREDFRRHVKSTLESKQTKCFEVEKGYEKGSMFFYNDHSNTMIVLPAGKAEPTAYRPRDFRVKFEDKVRKATTKQGYAPEIKNGLNELIQSRDNQQKAASKIKEKTVELRNSHIKEWEAHQKWAKSERDLALEVIEKKYRIEAKTQRIKSAQEVLQSKGTFFTRITGKHHQQLEAAKKEVKELRQSITENQRLAEQDKKQADEMICQRADELARQQEQESLALPTIPLDRSKAKEQEQQRPQFERGRGLEPPSYER